MVAPVPATVPWDDSKDRVQYEWIESSQGKTLATCRKTEDESRSRWAGESCNRTLQHFGCRSQGICGFTSPFERSLNSKVSSVWALKQRLTERKRETELSTAWRGDCQGCEAIVEERERSKEKASWSPGRRRRCHDPRTGSGIHGSKDVEGGGRRPVATAWRPGGGCDSKMDPDKSQNL